MAIRGNSAKGSERREKNSRESFYPSGEYTHHCAQNVTRNVNAKGASGELSDRNEECVQGHWPKGHPCHQVARNLAKLCSSVLWKVQLMRAELGRFLSRVLRISPCHSQ